jgi:hypothetical protein
MQQMRRRWQALHSYQHGLIWTIPANHNEYKPQLNWLGSCSEDWLR